MLAKIFDSGELRILNDTAQWWFSSGDMSLYLQIYIMNHNWTLNFSQPNGKFRFCIYLISVVESWMIKVMADAGSQEDTEIAFGKRVLEKKIRIQKN